MISCSLCFNGFSSHFSFLLGKSLASLFLFQSLVNYEGDNNDSQGQEHVAYFVAVLQCLLVYVMCGLVVGVLVYAPAYDGQYCVPNAGTNSGVQQELAQMHARQTSRNTDELTYGRNQSAKYGRGSAVLAEIFLDRKSVV